MSNNEMDQDSYAVFSVNLIWNVYGHTVHPICSVATGCEYGTSKWPVSYKHSQHEIQYMKFQLHTLLNIHFAKIFTTG